MKFTPSQCSSNLGIKVEDLDLASQITNKEIERIREHWIARGVAIFPRQLLSLDQYENFSQLFGPYGEEPFLIPMQDHPHVVQVHRKANEEAAHFGGAWHSDWSFQH